MDSADGGDAAPDSLPDFDALLASAVALMTAWADPCPNANLPPDVLRRLLGRKPVSNLCFLRRHPLAHPALRQALADAHAHWVGLAGQPVAGDDAASTWTASGALH